MTNNIGSIEYAEDCSYADSFDENKIAEEGDTFFTNIMLSVNNMLNLCHMTGIERDLPVCTIHNTIDNSCGSNWAKTALLCRKKYFS